MGLQRRSWEFPGSRRGKKSLTGSCPGLRSRASPPWQPDKAGEEASSESPHSPRLGAGRKGPGRAGLPGSRGVFQRHPGPSPHHKTPQGNPGPAASPALLNTAENRQPQTPDNRSLTGGDRWAQQAADLTHTVLHICVGEGLRNRPGRFEGSALPGLQARDPPNLPRRLGEGSHLP